MKEMELAMTSIFGGTSFKVDYLTKPNGLENFGFGRKVKMADRVQATNTTFVVAYPYFNVPFLRYFSLTHPSKHGGV